VLWTVSNNILLSRIQYSRNFRFNYPLFAHKYLRWQSKRKADLLSTVPTVIFSAYR